MNQKDAYAKVRGTRGLRSVRLLAVLLALPVSLWAQSTPWRLEGWGARAVVAISQPSGAASGVDTAGVKILCQGRVKADGSDYRVFDAAGDGVPFQLVYHDPDRYSLISLRASDPRQNYFIYFDNPDASLAGEQIVADPTPGAGPPQGPWIPRHGLVYATVERPEGDNPNTVEEMAELMAASPNRFGAGYQRRIADGYNPFGSSDLYISVYRGWVNLPRSGKHAFCTVSNEASFSFMDGRELIHWPGRHTAERGTRGEKNVEIDLSAGLHYIEYYHEEVYLQQMAFLGWRPPDVEGIGFSPIPESVFTAPHTAQAVRYETPTGPLARFEPVIADSIWPDQRHEGQYTRCLFEAGPVCEGAAFLWDFGDGQTAAGPTVEHVYLTPDLYAVTLTIGGPQGVSTARWPLRVYEIQHVTGQAPDGVPAEYLGIARTYDRGKLNAAQIKELAHLLAENDALAEALAASREFIDRFETSDTQWVPDMRRLMAECVLRQGESGVDEAIANYQAAVDTETSPSLKLDALARLIRLVGIERSLPQKAEELLAQVEAAAEGAGLDEEAVAAYRRAIIAAGDVRLWDDRPHDALDLYRRAEALAGNPIPPQVRAARTGAYPTAIREFLAGGNYGAALDVIDRWEETFPPDKCKGQTLFWRGKTLALRGQHKSAARHLALSVKRAVGASFESEARWLLAQALEQLGRADEARRELAKLAAIGLNVSFAQQARERLESSRAEQEKNPE